jgi:uncharacterized protein
MRTVGLIGLWALGVYSALLAFLYLTQSRHLYFPMRELVTTPRADGLPYEDVWLVAADGVRLHGWFVPAEAPRGTLLFLHGNAGNISHRMDSIRIFRELDLSVLIIDYRGYGQSGGRPDEPGLQRDVEAAWRYLRETRAVPANEIVVFGRSLGASLAAWLAARETPGAVILESPFTSAADLAAEIYPWLPVRRLIRFRYDTHAAARELRAPVLVVHSREDEIIPFRHGRAVFDAAGDPKALLEIRGGHNDGFLRSRAQYVEGLQRFLDAHLPSRQSQRR